MDQFFTIYTYTPWDNLNNNKLSKVRLLSLLSLFNKYPVIEPEFFDDLQSNIHRNKNYSQIKSIKRIVGPNKEDYIIKDWNFLWAMDLQKRIYQILFQKTGPDNASGIFAAIAPPELAKLLSQHKKEALLRIFSLLNNPEKLKFVLLLKAKGKSIAEEQQKFDIKDENLEKMKIMEYLKTIPNVDGQWFPNFAPKCPVCNAQLTSIKGYRVGFGKLVCSRCGYEKNKNP
ncbi:MAG: hypothetical protein GF317_11670 [Candidatus Lokiarchaeota archaeon]|nr:hypothetical protein [Candidatus Lokiarchaeota archaeon]MBD3200305.1 hypothetical protein [Candidatus Lokiarchaeota archaeon]